MNYLAHGDQLAEPATREGLLNALTHEPTWISMLVIAFFLFGVYALLEKFNVKPLNRLLSLIPFLILIAIVYLNHNAAVTTVVLSVGFVATFFLAFTMISRPADPKHKIPTHSEDSNEGNKK